MKLKRLLFLGFLILPGMVFAKSLILESVKTSSPAAFTRIEFQFNQKPSYHYFTLSNPNRFVIDFKGAKSKSPIKNATSGLLLGGIRAAQNKKALRVVLDVNQAFKTTVMNSSHHRLIVDLYPGQSTPVVKHLKKKAKVVHHTLQKKHVNPVRHTYLSVARLKQLAKPHDAVVVIDPGHGGKDPGATGPRGIHEKNVVLAMGLDLRAYLHHFALIHVDMTRHGDYFVTLRGRLRVAARDHANVFMAIHADSYINHTARGASVFALSEHGATSEAARWLARSENHAVLGGAKFEDHSRQVRSVLLDLSQEATIKDSLVFGKDVVHYLEKVTPMHSHRVDQAPFVVLKSPDIPSLLVETGFISNYQEEAQLNNPVHQHKVAHALGQGIVEYLYQYPPHDSFIAEQQAGHLTMKVKRGQSLGLIAEAYNVSSKRLASLNHIKHDKIKIGETLKIPRAIV